MTIEGALLKFVTVIVDPLVILVFALALLLFFWGLLSMMIAVSNGEDTATGKRHMLWGIVGMLIMFSVGGIINLINNSIGADTRNQRIEIDGGFK